MLSCLNPSPYPFVNFFDVNSVEVYAGLSLVKVLHLVIFGPSFDQLTVCALNWPNDELFLVFCGFIFDTTNCSFLWLMFIWLKFSFETSMVPPRLQALLIVLRLILVLLIDFLLLLLLGSLLLFLVLFTFLIFLTLPALCIWFVLIILVLKSKIWYMYSYLSRLELAFPDLCTLITFENPFGNCDDLLQYLKKFEGQH